MSRHPATVRRDLWELMPAAMFVAIALVSGFSASTHLAWFALATVLVAACFMMRTAKGRFLLYGFGLVGTAGTSAGVTTTELGYLVVLILIGAVALYRLTSDWNRLSAASRYATRGAFFILMACIEGFLVGVSQGWVLSDVARAVVPYLSLAVGILAAADARFTFKFRSVVTLTVLFGVATAISFMFFYIQARAIGVASVSPLPILPSVVLGGTTCAVMFAGSRRATLKGIAGMAVVVVVVGAVLASGTRTGLVLLAACLGALFVRGKILRGLVWQLVSLAVVGVGTAFLLTTFGTHLISKAYLAERVQSIKTIFASGVSSDASGVSRLDRYSAAWAYFQAHPWLGNGLGTPYVVGDQHNVLYLDTPLLYLAAFGVVGAALFGYGLVLVFRGAWCLAKSSDAQDFSRFVVGGCGLVWLAMSPFSAVVEDRGFGLGVALMLLVISPQSLDGRSRLCRDLRQESKSRAPVSTHRRRGDIEGCGSSIG